MTLISKEIKGLTHQTKGESLDDLYQRIDSLVKPLLEELGESEWGNHSFIITSDPAETGEEQGWVVRMLGGSRHYQIGIKDGGKQGAVFFIKTGGETVFSKDLTEEALRKAVNEAFTCGPTHLVPIGKSRK